MALAYSLQNVKSYVYKSIYENMIDESYFIGL
jgi:hypothetical protein